uniref:FKB95-like N-terminal Kelch domain-containing protein n=1 Tax=Brassica oleracea var. oleracea TaxID=109376 RepID=A0A0D3AAF1_BRAOL
MVSLQQPVHRKHFVGMVGSKHYAVRHYNIPPTSSPILIREEGTHTWRKAPSMKVARENPMVDILDGKIYVMGGCNADESTNWVDILRCLHLGTFSVVQQLYLFPRRQWWSFRVVVSGYYVPISFPFHEIRSSNGLKLSHVTRSEFHG